MMHVGHTCTALSNQNNEWLRARTLCHFSLAMDVTAPPSDLQTLVGSSFGSLPAAPGAKVTHSLMNPELPIGRVKVDPDTTGVFTLVPTIHWTYLRRLIHFEVHAGAVQWADFMRERQLVRRMIRMHICCMWTGPQAGMQLCSIYCVLDPHTPLDCRKP